ncbi:MAG: NAD(P)H-dependent oxidoreductase [Aestuariibaculum sp.]
MDIIKQLKWRYATKKFDSTKKLSSEKINRLKEAFNLTATSFGLQTVRLAVVENKTIRELLVPHTYNQKQVLDASHLFVICIQDNISEADVENYYINIKTIRNTSETILKPYQDELTGIIEGMTVKERQHWAKYQAYIVLGNLMTVCAAEQIDACPMEGFVPTKYDTILGLKGRGLKSVLLLPVGYRATDDMFADFEKVRMAIHESVIEI